MKLELKHLAPYLPYGLKLFYTHTEKIGQISNIYSIGEGFDNDDIKISIDYSDGEHIWMYKPILRPLADLTDRENVIGLYYAENWSEFLQEIETGIIPYNILILLLENHFDVFGLIEKGLAIDINTLKQ